MHIYIYTIYTYMYKYIENRNCFYREYNAMRHPLTTKLQVAFFLGALRFVFGVNVCGASARSVQLLLQKSCANATSGGRFSMYRYFLQPAHSLVHPQLYISSSDGIGSTSHNLPPGHAIFGLFPPIF